MKLKKISSTLLLLTFVFCENPKNEKFMLKAIDFKSEIGGKSTDLYLLKNKQIEVYITNYGGRIVSLLTPDKKVRWEMLYWALKA